MGSITVLYVLANIAYVCSFLSKVSLHLTGYSLLVYPERSF